MKNVNFLKMPLLFILLLSGFFGHAQDTSIPDPNFEQALIDLNIDSGPIDGKVLTANIANITSLIIPGKNISNLTGIEAFVKLEKLDLGLYNNDPAQKNNIATLNLTNNVNLRYLDCSFNELSTLDLSNNTILRILFLQNNKFSSIDVSHNIVLETLFCFSNQLTTVNVSKNTSLTSLSCYSNPLTGLDLSTNFVLKDLNCSFNNLSSLNVSVNIALENLNVSNNNLTSLNVTNNTALNVLNCHQNQLTSLDLSKNINLFNFWCNNNQLTNLNLKNGKNTSLTSVDFRFNSSLTCIQVDNASYSTTNWTAKDNAALYSNNCNATSIAPPKIKATDDQFYCPLTSIKIAPSLTITHDLAEPGTQAAYIQISSGYVNGQDKIEIPNPAAHPTIVQAWYPLEGKLVLSSPTGGNVPYSELESAIKDVVFSNSLATASGTRTFSITIGQANYLPSTKHFYLYVPSVGISWSSAKFAAENSTYYGLKGYLATLLAADEAKLCGEQASGTGWIGGSDAETEGVWKWVTGPEAGTIFWNGTTNGSTPNFAFWNTGEPNQLGDEDYAHITQPGVGIQGSWNDLSNSGDPTGNYQPKGYIVEYGGSPGEAPLEIAASTKITIPVATPGANPDTACDSGTFTFNATATTGATISWYATATGGTALKTGNSFTTPTITSTTTYYVDAGCESNRKAVTATVNATPATPIAGQPFYHNCGPGPVTIQASSNIGYINWYATSTGGPSLFTGESFTTPIISANTTYYAEASNNGCINNTRIPVEIKIYTPPVVTDETKILCQNQKVNLDAGVAGMSYKWSTDETAQIITVTTPGTYTVKVISPDPENCPSEKTIIVNEHLIPEISRVDVDGTKATIHLTKDADYYEYSVDGLPFQDSNVFYDVPAGLRTAFVQEKNGCEGDTFKFIVISFPAFFTPNNDSFNDSWEVEGIENYPQAQITIFDRYGKLVAQLNGSKMSWDGTLDKNPLPASDYWYAMKIDNEHPVLRGHFSLKR